MTRRLAFAIVGAWIGMSPGLADAAFSATERAVILSFGPWPPAWQADPSNRVSGDPAAVAFGERLFSDRRLSKDSRISCADCHQPERAFTDGVALNQGHGPIHRHTPSVVDLRWAHWFGWGGEADNLWAQSVRPILSPNEMAATAADIRRLIINDPALACRFRTVFKTDPKDQDEQTVLVNTGKALAAFQETLVSGRTPFDDFRDAMARRDTAGMARYPAPAVRGLQTFVGKGRCQFCHFGPRFTNGEFGDIGVPFFTGSRRLKGNNERGIDKGRYGGIQALRASDLNLLGPFNDAAGNAAAVRTRHVARQHRNWGEFKVPSLRNVAATAPYMHNGSVATLDDVINFYSELNEDRLHTDGEKILRPLNLSDRGKADLKAFLESLSASVMRIRPSPSKPLSEARCPEK